MVAERPLSSTGSSNNAPTGQEWACDTRRKVGERAATGDITKTHARLLLACASFAERTGAYGVVGHEIDLWGYGDVHIWFATAEGRWWCSLGELIEPTGVPYDVLLNEYTKDVEDGYGGVEELSWIGENGELALLEMVDDSFALRIMSGVSPWAGEFMKALFPTLRRAMVKSGLADKLGPVTRIREDGTADETTMTFGEFLAKGQPLASREEAREQAFRGPAGAL
jgi:hypothetical protein